VAERELLRRRSLDRLVAVDFEGYRSSHLRQPATEGGKVQYALLIYGEDGRWDTLSAEEQEAQTKEYMAIGMSPQTKAGAELDELSKATTVRVNDGKTLTTDGPFAETKEYLGGFYIVECDNLDEAIEVAARIPAARTGGAIEVRPVVPH
jgi:hypothetical protein